MPFARTIRESSVTCSPSLTPEGCTHAAAGDTEGKDDEARRTAKALGFNSGSLASSHA